jgi:uncharacterized protein involved in response to NO
VLFIMAVIGGRVIPMFRTARGHTGRPLVADGFEVVCFVLIVLAAAVGVLGGMLLPSAYLRESPDRRVLSTGT